jgi:site-specific DNA recombinase
MTLRAAGLIRVSDLSQVEGHSLDAQERFFREFCQNRGWEVVRIYREEGVSAHVDALTRRPVVRQLLDDASKHEFDVVVAHTLDRIARNLRVLLDVMGTLGKLEIGLVTIVENVDYSSPMGRHFIRELGSMAELTSDMIGIHVSKGLSQRAHEGKHLGGIPFGYESCYSNGDE